MIPLTIIPHRAMGDRGPSWYRWGDHVFIRCGECDHPAALRGFQIADDGTVSPAYLCATIGCSWQVFAKLDDWDE